MMDFTKYGFMLSLLCAAACSGSPRTGDLSNAYRDIAPTASTVSERRVPAVQEAAWPERFAFGTIASKADIKRWDIDVKPDGQGLPNGKGKAEEGEAVYRAKCAACHGMNGDEGPYDVLISSEKKSIGTYWPYATTLFDYIRRTMPFNMPGTLTDEEVYQLTAYLLSANGIIDSNEVMDAKRLPRVEMPARASFVPDDRKGGPEIK